MSKSEKGLRWDDGRCDLPIVGAVVIQVRIDFAFGLVAQGDSGGEVSCETRISGSLRYESGGTSQTIDPEHNGRLTPLISLHNAAIEEAHALEDGHLELRFDQDRAIHVPPDPHYEAWEVTVTNRSMNWSTTLVSLPGSGTAAYDTPPRPARVPAARITIVHTRTAMLLTKEAFRDWREIQDRFDDYMASLGPYTLRALLDYLAAEYPKDPPFPHETIIDFLQSDHQELWS